MRLSIPLIVVFATLLTNCASIVKGTDQLVSIDSNVRDAEIVVNGAVVGKTPFNGKISRSSDTIVTLRKDGYTAKSVTLNTEVEPVFWGNIIFGGVLGSTTDLSSGAMYKYSPSNINVDLYKVGN